MPAIQQLRLVLLWHMHQPDFRDFNTGEFTQPWVYLHAIKDYTDMAAHLENHPGVHAVVNLVPILLDQLEDYADQFATGKIRDPLLRLLARENLDDIDFRGAGAGAESVLPRQPHQDDRAVHALQAAARSVSVHRIDRGRSRALSLRSIPGRSADLVPPVLDRGDGPPQGRDGGAADDPGRELQPRRPDRAVRADRRADHRHHSPLPQTRRFGARRNLDHAALPSDRPARCSISAARAKPRRRRPCRRPTTIPVDARA